MVRELLLKREPLPDDIAVEVDGQRMATAAFSADFEVHIFVAALKVLCQGTCGDTASIFNARTRAVGTHYLNPHPAIERVICGCSARELA